MKVLKIIGKVLVIGIIGLLVIAVMTEGILSRLDKKELNPPGTLVEVGGEHMHIYAVGSGEERIVLIPGGGVHAPYVDFQPLWSRLAEESRVVVVERFGYGFSEVTKRERTLKNIVEEMRDGLNMSGENPPYTLAGHSLGGLIAIAYSQAYPDEVKNIIMLDSRVPEAYLEQDLSGEAFSLALASTLKHMGLVRLTPMESVYELGEMNEYMEVPKELWEIDRKLYIKNFMNKNVREEIVNISNFGNYAMNSTINYQIPTLFISTPDLMDRDKEAEYLEKLDKGKLIEMDGGHHIHQYFPNEVSNEIHRFIH